MLTLNDGSTVEIDGSGELTDTMTNEYKPTVVKAEIGDLCTSIGIGVFASSYPASRYWPWLLLFSLP